MGLGAREGQFRFDKLAACGGKLLLESYSYTHLEVFERKRREILSREDVGKCHIAQSRAPSAAELLTGGLC